MPDLRDIKNGSNFSHDISNIFLPYHEKLHPPAPQLARDRRGVHPPVNPSLSYTIPD